MIFIHTPIPLILVLSLHGQHTHTFEVHLELMHDDLGTP